MALSTFSDLKTEIANHLDRDDLTSKIPNFIILAEARIRRDIRIREMITRTAITIDARYEDLPAGFLEGINFRLLTDPVTELRYLSPERLTAHRTETTGKPLYYTIGAQMEFDKAPDASYSGEMLYYKEATALSDDNTTNVIMTRAPDVYLYASLLASAPYLLNDERIEIWASLYKSAVEGLSRKDKYIGPMSARVVGV